MMPFHITKRSRVSKFLTSVSLAFPTLMKIITNDYLHKSATPRKKNERKEVNAKPNESCDTDFAEGRML